MRGTKIEWCDDSLNLAMGCDGCELWNPKAGLRHCYAGVLTDRLGGQKGYPERFDQPRLFLERLDAALRWPDLTGKSRPHKPWLDGLPRVIFLGDMGDNFTESLPEDWLAPVLPRLADSPHQWLLLTKRARRMRQFARQHSLPPNVWAGVSLTGLHNERAQALRNVPARIRFLSVEPLLYNPDLTGLLTTGGIHWVIAGGESGAGARRTDPAWVRDLRDQCLVAGVPFFFKQWGAQEPGRRLDGREWSEMPRREESCPPA